VRLGVGGAREEEANNCKAPRVSEWEKKVLAKGWGGRVAMGGVEWARIGGVRILTGRMITLQINEMRVTYFCSENKTP